MQEAWVGLARRARDGDMDAFAMLVERFKRPLCAAMHPILRDWHLAQDVAQEAFLAIHSQLRDLDQPDYGDAVTIRSGEVPAFWACGVTPLEAIMRAQPDLAITHEPGHMFVTDIRDSELCNPTS